MTSFVSSFFMQNVIKMVFFSFFQNLYFRCDVIQICNVCRMYIIHKNAMYRAITNSLRHCDNMAELIHVTWYIKRCFIYCTYLQLFCDIPVFMFYIYQYNHDNISISWRFVCVFIRELKILHRIMYMDLNHALLTVYRRYL